MKDETKFPVAEKFKAPQGEGLYTGTPMAFVRLVGCSVSKKVCTRCDTDYDQMLPGMGGGLMTPEQVLLWTGSFRHVCLTGGEPLDRDLRPLLDTLCGAGKTVHVETSGTRVPDWLDPQEQPRKARHAFATGNTPSGRPTSWRWLDRLWITVSPKPGYSEEFMLRAADEIKVILGGLAAPNAPGWPTVADAVRWADAGKLVYLQPCNGLATVDQRAMDVAIGWVETYPVLRLSLQAHKYLRTR